MERRHQVFISSTFSDLVEERREIIQAVLELDCFPAGMELFPATHDGAWDLIKRVIDDSDYYCLVIGGRYGSLDVDGIGFTEKEYDYAVGVKKPVMAFMHSKPNEIAVGKAELSADGRQRLEAFRQKVESAHHCKYWSTAEDLGAKVSRGLIALKKSHPSDGWVPGAFAADDASRIERANLRARVAELEVQLVQASLQAATVGSTDLASGKEKFDSGIFFGTKLIKEAKWWDVAVSWDEILSYVGPILTPECTEEEFVDRLQLCLIHATAEQLADGDEPKFSDAVMRIIDIDQVKVQLRALGYMIPGVKRRAVSDKKVYWKLSKLGEDHLLSVQAIRSSVEHVVTKELAQVASNL